MLRRRSKSKPKSMKDYHDRIAQLGCLVCGAAATIHHVTATIHGGRIIRRDDRVVPLCPMHHQKIFDPLASDPVSVEGLSHKGFFKRHGIDLLAEAERLANG